MRLRHHRYFALFLIYMWSACVYGTAILTMPFINLMYHQGGKGSGPQMPYIAGPLASVSMT